MYPHDSRANLVQLTRPDGIAITTEYNASGKPVRITDPGGAVWRQEWDENGRLIRQSSPLGAVSQYHYDRFGQLTAYTDPLGAVTRFDFDQYGNLTRLTDAQGHTTQFNYDYMGRLTARIDPLRRRTNYQYDPKGRLVKAVLPGGNTISCAYDAEDNLISYTDENGAVTRLEYCGVNELKRRIQPDGQTVEYEYNQEEQLIAVINQRGERYELKRDPVGRIVEEVDYWGQSRKYRYSPAGYLLESTDPLGQTIRYRTDHLGRILEKILPGLPGTNQNQTESFQYDANGNLTQCANGETVVKRRFDLEGKLIEEQQGPDCQITYQYDLNGNRISRTTTLKNGVTTRSHTVNYTYDCLGRAATVAIGDHQPIQFTRNPGGQIIREILGSHLKRWSEYNESGYLSRQTVGANGGPLFEQEYSYDRTGNLIKKVDSVFGTDKYFYDTMGRINRQIDPLGQVQKFIYDPAGDRLVTRIAESADGDWSRIGECDQTIYRFNRAGNLESRTGKQETTEFIWDANQRLIASIKDGQRTTYGYDPLGRRISKTTAGVATRFYWDGDALLGELRFETQDGTDAGAEPVCTRWREWVYYPGSFEPLVMLVTDTTNKDNETPERIYYYANDPNGCPTRLLDEAGKVVWAALYDAWGKVKKLPANEVDQPLRLQGQYFDAETELYYNRFRYYCPEIGAFISQDPLGLAAGENIYWFAPNAQGWIDPLGLECEYKNLSRSDRKGLQELAILRKELGGIPAKSGPDDGTLAMLQIGKNKYYGVNAHGQQIALKPSNGWIARSSVHHAEGDVFNQALKDGASNNYARLFVDKELCRNCDSIAGVKDFAR